MCLACRRRFTTYERASEGFHLAVIKKDKSHVPYDREKITAGLEKACYKRPVSPEQIQEIVDKIEEILLKHYDKEVSTAIIGQVIMKYLRAVDKIAYVRFASICRDYKSVTEFIDEVRLALEHAEPLEQLRFFED